MIKCPYCLKHVAVEDNRLASHGDCRGSGARVEGNWRDDPSFAETELAADARRRAEASSYFAPLGRYRRMFTD